MANSRVVLITGANRGLGLEVIKAAMSKSSNPYTIILGSRSLSGANDAIKSLQSEYPSASHVQLEPLAIDMESDASIEAAKAHVEKHHGRLDVLVNNAGAQHDHDDKLTTRQKFAKNWDVNVTGSHLLTEALAPLLAKSSADPTLIFLASGTGTLAGSEDGNFWFNKSPPAGFPKQGPSLTAYRSVKTGLNMVMRDWHRILANDGVQVYSISPGFLATGLGINDPERLKTMGAEDPQLGGKLIVDVFEGKRKADEGKVVSRHGTQPW